MNTPTTPKPITTIFAPKFQSPKSFQLMLWRHLLRLALVAGHPVVLVGGCRTGKSLLLGQLTPGKVIDKRGVALSAHGRFLLTDDEIPDGIFGVDEAQLIEPVFLESLASRAATEKRSFCFASQRYDILEKAIDCYRAAGASKRVLLVVLGGLNNPSHILNTLPGETVFIDL